MTNDKTQAVRLVDVLILGPFMIWAGMQLAQPWARAAMIGAGGATIAYNWRNYQLTQELQNRQAIEKGQSNEP